MCRFNNQCRATETVIAGRINRFSHMNIMDLGCPLGHGVRNISFQRNDRLYHQGDSVRGIFNLTSGLVALERVDEHGESVILRVVRTGAFFSCTDLFGDAIHAATARAITDVKACFLTAPQVLHALADPDLRREILRVHALAAREDQDSIFRLCASNLSARLLAVLMSLADSDGHTLDGPVTVQMPVSWQDVSSMVGSSPEVISRTLRKLRQSGHIEMRGRVVTIYPEANAPSRMAH